MKYTLQELMHMKGTPEPVRSALQAMSDDIARLNAKPDVFPHAHRLALELECLLLSCKDTAAVSKWWDSSNDALEQWREFCRTELQPKAT